MTTERVLCMCFGYVPIFIGGGEGLRVEQRGPVRGEEFRSFSEGRSKRGIDVEYRCRFAVELESLGVLCLLPAQATQVDNKEMLLYIHYTKRFALFQEPNRNL